jgi:GTP-binding protein HflX
VKKKVSKARAKWEGAEAEDEADGDPDAERDRRRADLVAVDHELTPSQARNLERATGVPVLDRPGVIVEIFHRHAKSREARLQVEIARLTYMAPRLRETGGGDRQQGGIGVGAKGAGESALELDRRKVRDRLAELKAELQSIQSEQSTRRARRAERYRVSLVGYTNAGKSSLMAALTGSQIYVADKLFATLDTTVRTLQPETVPRILVSDTVGFIRSLPHDLVASFRSTLDEALEASLLLHVVDAGDPTFRDQMAVTREVLAEIGAGDVPRQVLLNKIDRVDAAEREALAREIPDAIQLSAHDSGDIEKLHAWLVAWFDRDLVEAEIFVPWAEGAKVGDVHASTRVLEERHEADGIRFRVKGRRGDVERLAAR